MSIDMEISVITKKLLADFGKSQRETARTLGISSASINQMLSGKASLPIVRFREIVADLNIDPSDDRMKLVDQALKLYEQKELEKSHLKGMARMMAASGPQMALAAPPKMHSKELAKQLWNEYKKQIQEMIMKSDDLPPELQAKLWVKMDGFVPEFSDNITLWLERASSGLLIDAPSQE